MRYFGKRKEYLLTKMVKSKGILKGAKSAQLRCIFILSHGIGRFWAMPGRRKFFHIGVEEPDSFEREHLV